jgi:hypothetical protein
MSSWRQIQHEHQLANDGEHIAYDRHNWTAQVCLAGHVQHGGFRVMPTEKYCECNAETVHQCPSCGNNIKGASRTFAVSIKKPPMGCLKCGKPYPWTQAVIDKINVLIDESVLTAIEKQETKTDLDSIIKNTPGAESAARRTHGRIARIGGVLRAAYQDYIVPLAAETISKIIKG